MAPFAALNADERVMEHFLSTLEREQSDMMARWAEAQFESEGFGFWAVEVPGIAPFIGFVGLNRVRFQAHFTPAVEVAWRLAHPYWGRGYASEAARAAVAFGFSEFSMDEIVSFAPQANRRSIAVMQRVGMTHRAVDDFDHPRIEPGHRLRRFELYRLRRPAHEA